MASTGRRGVTNFADAEEEGDVSSARAGIVGPDGELPPPQITGPDEKGIKTVVEYAYEGEEDEIVVKITRKIKVTKRRVVIPRVVAQRRQLPRFGKAAGDRTTNLSMTFRSRDEIRIEKPGEDLHKEKRDQDELIAKLTQKHRERLDKKLLEDAGLRPSSSASSSSSNLPPSSISEAPSADSMASRLAPGSYVPPHLRRAPGAAEGEAPREETTTLRIANVSENATENDLLQLVRPFGPVTRYFLARDRETNRSRGFGYVTFYNRADAERAKEKLHGHGYDHLILTLEWAQTYTRDAGSENVMRSGIVSGYGKALPQG